MPPFATAQEGVVWVNNWIKDRSCLNIDDLSWVELHMRKAMRLWHDFYKKNCPGFENSFTNWLASGANMPVVLAKDNDSISAGKLYVAPTDKHLVVKGCHYFLEDTEKVLNQKPSVDVLFRTASAVFKDRLIGLLLTGMGKDGAEGCAAIRSNGGKTLVQDRESHIQRPVAERIPQSARQMALVVIGRNVDNHQVGVVVDHLFSFCRTYIHISRFFTHHLIFHHLIPFRLFHQSPAVYPSGLDPRMMTATPCQQRAHSARCEATSDLLQILPYSSAEATSKRQKRHPALPDCFRPVFHAAAWKTQTVES